MPPVRTMHLLKETDEVLAYSSLDRQRYTPTPKPSVNDIPLSRSLTSAKPRPHSTSHTSELARQIRETGPTSLQSSTLGKLFRRHSFRPRLPSLPERPMSKALSGEARYYVAMTTPSPEMAAVKAPSHFKPKDAVVAPKSSKTTDSGGMLGSSSLTSAKVTANSKNPSDGPIAQRTSLGASLDTKQVLSGKNHRVDEYRSAKQTGIVSKSEPTVEETDYANLQSPQAIDRTFTAQSATSSSHPEDVALLTKPFDPSDKGHPNDGQVLANTPLPLPSDPSSKTLDQNFGPLQHSSRPLPDPATHTVNSRLTPYGRPSPQFQLQSDGSPQQRLRAGNMTGDSLSQAAEYRALLVGSNYRRHHHIPAATMGLSQGPPPNPPPTSALPLAPDGTSGRMHVFSPDQVTSLSGRQTNYPNVTPSRPTHIPRDSCVVAPLAPRSSKTPPEITPPSEKSAKDTSRLGQGALDAIACTRMMRDRKLRLLEIQEENERIAIYGEAYPEESDDPEKYAANRLVANQIAAKQLAAKQLAAKQPAANQLAANQIAANQPTAKNTFRLGQGALDAMACTRMMRDRKLRLLEIKEEQERIALYGTADLDDLYNPDPDVIKRLAANKLAANQLAANQLAANQLAANQLTANQLATDQLATNTGAGKRSSLGHRTIRYADEVDFETRHTREKPNEAKRVSSGAPNVGREPFAADKQARRASHPARGSSQSGHGGPARTAKNDRARPSNSERTARNASMTSVSSTAKRTSYGGSHQEPSRSAEAERIAFLERENVGLRATVRCLLDGTAPSNTPHYE
ncbi:MAG: hypothetical protein M1836_004703 [Candelina mexicana]|nr:MAG: hypothetical protein M1836_004703 [Candelina mexicana]